MIRIDRRFRGPASSGNGGYTAGLFAARLPSTAVVQVTLHRPPPLDIDVAVRDAGPERIELLNAGDVIADALTVPEDSLGPPVQAVDLATARTAENAYAGAVSHPFPECFVCGPARTPGDGLRLTPGRLPGGRTACTWTADESLTSAGSVVGNAYVWAAMDCPGGWTGDLQGRPMVLGRITASVDSPVHAGDRCVVVGQWLGTAGRKTWTATTVYAPDGRVHGRARHTWIHVDPANFG